MTTITEALERFADHRNTQGVRPNTLRVHLMWFRLWQRWRDEPPALPPLLADVTAEELGAFMRYLRDEHSPVHNNPRSQAAKAGRLGQYSLLSAWRSLRAFWRFCAEAELLSASQEKYFPQRVPMPQVDEPIRETFPPELLDQLLVVCTTPRDRALLLLLAESGARASEVCGLEIEHLDLAQRSARLRGKGGRWRWVFWGPSTADALEAYLISRPPVTHPFVFVSQSKINRGAPLVYQGLRLLFRRLAQRAGVDLPIGSSIHSIRHAYAHKVLDAGVDGLHLMQLLGHSDQRVTARYVRENPGKLRSIHRRIFQAHRRIFGDTPLTQEEPS